MASRFWTNSLLFLITAVSALGIGFLLGDSGITFRQPALLALAIPAGVLGYFTRRGILGALMGVLAGFAGGAGIPLRISPHEEHWGVVIIIFGCLGGILCVVAGALAGWAGEREKGQT